MNAETVTRSVLDAVRILIWPTTIFVVVLLFRRQVAERLSSLRQADLPGGIHLELDALARAVTNTPEVEASKASSSVTTDGAAVADRLYAVAGVRVDLDRLLRRLSKAALRDQEFATRDLNEILLDLRDAGELSPSVMRQTQEFLRFASVSFGSKAVTDDDIVSLLTVGSLLTAHVHYRERVASIVTEHWGHDIAFHLMHDEREERNPKARWAVVATLLPEVDYNYLLFIDALRRAAGTDDNRNWPRSMSHRFPLLEVPRRDFLDIIRFRRNELRRLLRDGEGHWWEDNSQSQDWRDYKWPEDWGHIEFNTPVLRHGTPDDVADDLLRAEAALRRMRLELEAAS